MTGLIAQANFLNLSGDEAGLKALQSNEQQLSLCIKA